MKNLVLETKGAQGKCIETISKGHVQVSSGSHMAILETTIENPVITLSVNGADYFHGTFEELKHRLKPEN